MVDTNQLQPDPKLSEVLDALVEMVVQHCSCGENEPLDSFGDSTNAEAMRLLAEHGRFEIEEDRGRRVIGRIIYDDR